METKNELRERLISYIDAEISKVVKPEIEVGKWYKLKKDNKIIVKLIDETKGFGISYNSSNTYIWSDEILILDILAWELMTESEIFEALKTECLKLGFKKGCDHTITNGSDMINNTELCFYYQSNFDKMLLNGWCVYEKGKFATVIESKQTIESTTGNVLVFTKPIDNELLTKIKNLL